MKLVSYKQLGKDCLGLLVNDYVYEVSSIGPGLPDTMEKLLIHWEKLLPKIENYASRIEEGFMGYLRRIKQHQLTLLSPVPNPGSCRDGYAFRQHVEAARRNRGLAMIAEFDNFPIFYFANHRTVMGPGNIYCMRDHFQQLDFELEVAIVISKKGKNISAAEADDYIGGMMIMNDWSARQLQKEEMLLNLGPAKGKDFATSYGPWLVTSDELAVFEISPPKNHVGKAWKMNMTATVNGIQVSSGNLQDMDWTFAEIIERASYGVTLHPGDIIGSGTIGTGCFLELNGTGKLQNELFCEQWLKEDDTIVLEIEGLGRLENRIMREPGDYSLTTKAIVV